MFQDTQNDAYFDLITRRVKDEYLVWVEQFLDIIQDFLKNDPPIPEGERYRLNDIGANVGQFWKGLKRRGLPLDYFGYDIEPRYLDAAQGMFPDLEGRLSPLDITCQKPERAHITVVSSVVEHLHFLTPAMDHMMQTTDRLLLLRTFLGEHSLKAIRMKKGAKEPYHINQYAFLEMLERFDHNGFETRVVRDRYTDSMPEYQGQGIIRTQFVVIGIRTR